MSTVSIESWISEVKATPGFGAVGMFLVHHGVVRGTSHTGEPVSGLTVAVDRERLEQVLAEARTWPGIFAVRVWINEGPLTVGDDIMKVLVAGDIRDNVFGALQRLVNTIKSEVTSKTEHA